jgi:hypothetical protein
MRKTLPIALLGLLSACVVAAGDENAEATYRCETNLDCLEGFQCLNDYCSKIVPRGVAKDASTMNTSDSGPQLDAAMNMDSTDSGVHPDAANLVPDSGVYLPYSMDVLKEGEVAPPIYWTSVFDANGATEPFGMESFHYASKYERYDSMVLVLLTDWDGYSAQRVTDVDTLAATLDDNNMFILYALRDSTDRETRASSWEAQMFVNENQSNSGLRVGDADTMLGGIRTPVLRNSPFIAVPHFAIIRKSDMVVLSMTGFGGDLVQEAMNLKR